MVAVNGSSMVCQGKIDTLYSWGPAKKISWLQGQSYSGRLTRDGTNAPIFTTQTSYATYGYGDYAIRFHIGSNARFQFFDNVNAYDVCEQVPSSQVDNTIAVRYWAIGAITGVDYILCGLGPIESWSYGTRTHYQEFSRETSWISANNYRNYELYVKQDGVDQIPPILDSHSFAPSVWTGNLSRHAATFPGRIFFNPSAPNQDEASHFATKWGTYINSSGGGGGGGAVIGNGGGGAVLPQGGGNDADDLRPQDLVGGKFKDTQGRSLWLNPGRVCTVKRATGTPQSCAWEFRSGGTIVVTMAPSTIWYYSAKNKDSVCFTGEGTPGATCVGIMTRYN